MFNLGSKNSLWKAVGKQPLNSHLHEGNDVQEGQHEKQKEANRLNNNNNHKEYSKSKRPPPLMINNNLGQKYSGVRIQDNHQQRQSFQKTFVMQQQIQQPVSPWMNDQGDKISHIMKKSQLEDQLSFSIEKGMEAGRQQQYMSMVRENKGEKGNVSIVREARSELPIYVVQSVSYMKDKEKMQMGYVKRSRNGQNAYSTVRDKIHQQSIRQLVAADRQNYFIQQIHQLKHQLALQKITHQSQNHQYQNQIKSLTRQITAKTNLIYKLTLKLKSLSSKIQQLNKLFNFSIKPIPQQLKSFRINQLIKINTQVYDKLVEHGYQARQQSQNCLEEEYEKRKLVEKECQDARKRVGELEGRVFGLEQEKGKMEKVIRDLQFTNASSQAQRQQIQIRAKKVLQQKSQLSIQLQTLQSRNTSLKQHIAHITKNVHNKSSKEGQEGEELVRKCNMMKRELEEKEREMKEMRKEMERMKQEEKRRMEMVEGEIREVEGRVVQYRNKLREEVQTIEEKLKEQQLAHQSTKHSLQSLQLKLKQQQLLHYKQIQTYDQALREIQKDLQILGMKRNLKEEELGKKQLQLGKRENDLLSLQDDVRQQKNQLECAIQLYKQNLALLKKKEEMLGNQYHETLEMQTQSKAAWYDRYYKLYSSSNNNIFNANTQGKHQFSAITNFNPNICSIKSQKHNNSNSNKTTQRTPFVDPPYLNDIKKIAIKQRLNQIDNLKSRVKTKPQSPRQFTKTNNNQVLSRPQSPRTVNLVHKAKSIQTQRHQVKSPWRQRPERDNSSGKNIDMVSLSIARSHSPKNTRTNVNKDFSVVKAKLDQIKASISNQISAAGKR